MPAQSMTKGMTGFPAANRLWLKWASGACLLTNLLLLAWYIFQGYKHVIHGDSPLQPKSVGSR